MIIKINLKFLAVITLILLPILESTAQSYTDQEIANLDGKKTSGSYTPVGPPLEQPVRVSSGGNCIVDIKQAYTVLGTLSGSLEIDYRIICIRTLRSTP